MCHFISHEFQLTVQRHNQHNRFSYVQTVNENALLLKFDFFPSFQRKTELKFLCNKTRTRASTFPRHRVMYVRAQRAKEQRIRYVQAFHRWSIWLLIQSGEKMLSSIHTRTHTHTHSNSLILCQGIMLSRFWRNDTALSASQRSEMAHSSYARDESIRARTSEAALVLIAPRYGKLLKY